MRRDRSAATKLQHFRYCVDEFCCSCHFLFRLNGAQVAARRALAAEVCACRVNRTLSYCGLPKSIFGKPRRSSHGRMSSAQSEPPFSAETRKSQDSRENLSGRVLTLRIPRVGSHLLAFEFKHGLTFEFKHGSRRTASEHGLTHGRSGCMDSQRRHCRGEPRAHPTRTESARTA